MRDGTSIGSQSASDAKRDWDPKPFEDRLLLLSIDEVYAQAAKRALHQFPDAFSSLREVAQVTGLLRTHSSRVARFAVKLARHLGSPVGEQDLLYVAAMVHDVGAVLVKPARSDLPNTPENHLLDHTVIGRHLIVESFFSTPKLTETIADIVLCHHERWDGQGYPFALRGENIPLLSRIISMASEFDALVSRTDVLPSQAVEQAYDSILRERARAFDPDCVDVFERHHEFLTLGLRLDAHRSANG